MQQHLDIGVLANLVSMLRADVDGAMWLADDNDEAPFYERFADRQGRVVAAPGVALPLLDLVEARGVQGVVVTVRGPVLSKVPRESVFSPSLGDVASLLLSSPTSERVLVDVCGIPWLKACQKQFGSVQHQAVFIANSTARLRQESTRPETFNDVASLIAWDTFGLDWKIVRPIALAAGVPVAILEEIMRAVPGSDIRSDLLRCDGNEALGILAAATQFFHPRGITAHRAVSSRELLSMLRVAFDLSELEVDDMFWQMKRWERLNPDFPLLQPWRITEPLGVLWDQRYWHPDLLTLLRLRAPEEGFAVLKMDLDNFSIVNNTLGHTKGDEALRLYFAIAKRILGGRGEVYRRGGDEVVALLPGMDAETARDMGELVRSTIESEFRQWSKKHELPSVPTASIGIALGRDKPTAEEIVRLMDDAQQRAKREGKNRVVILDSH